MPWGREAISFALAIPSPLSVRYVKEETNYFEEREAVGRGRRSICNHREQKTANFALRSFQPRKHITQSVQAILLGSRVSVNQDAAGAAGIFNSSHVVRPFRL